MVKGKRCRKHLSPFTRMIRVEEIDSEEEMDPDLSFHQVFRFFLGDLSAPQYSLQQTLEKAAQMERQQKHQARSIHQASAAKAKMVAAEARDNFHRHGLLVLDQELGTAFRDVFQGAEAHNCGFMAALAAIADHEDGYLVRNLLLQLHKDQGHNDDLQLV
eukprot:Skav212960  [mRNA]  locus=scaffold3901:64632:66506:- [translate_table: standard]